MLFQQIFWLSLVQGLTEFLPVSSSGHLILFSKFFDMKDQGLTIDVALHLGSLLAVMIYFAPLLLKMFSEMAEAQFKPDFEKKYNKLFWLIALASLPALVVGFLLRHEGAEFLRKPEIIGWTILFYGLVLYVADRFSPVQKELKDMGLKEAIFIGIAQCLALVPGTSRSGITITMARFLKINRVDAARFSMLLSMPVIAGAGLLEAYRLFYVSDMTALTDAVLAVVCSFLSSYLVIYLMMKWLQRWTYLPFVIYRVVLGLLLILPVLF